jgi:GT2 family glycosyltransferase
MNAGERMYDDFLAHLNDSKDTAGVLASLSFDQSMVLRFFFNLLSHVRPPASVRLPATPSNLTTALSSACAFWGADAPTGVHDDTPCDLVFGPPPGKVKANGWLITPPDATPGDDRPGSFVLETDLFGWCIYRRQATDEDFTGRIHIIVPTYNHCALLRECMAHVDQQTVARHVNCIVIDDGSTDGVAEMMAQEFPHMTVLAGDGNLWWGGAINKGLGHIRTIAGPDDFVVFLNNDVMMASTTLEHILALAMRDRATCWATAAVTPENAQASGERGHALYRFEWMVDLLSQHGQAVEVSYLFGRTTIMPIELFAAVPGIDTHLFRHYWSDSDFSLRAKAAGYATCITGHSFVRLHHDTETTGTHIDFFATGRTLREIWTYFTDIKSLGNLKFAWRFHSRHNHDHRLGHVWQIFRKGVANHKWLRRDAGKGGTR